MNNKINDTENIGITNLNRLFISSNLSYLALSIFNFAALIYLLDVLKEPLLFALYLAYTSMLLLLAKALFANLASSAPKQKVMTVVNFMYSIFFFICSIVLIRSESGQDITLTLFMMGTVSSLLQGVYFKVPDNVVLLISSNDEEREQNRKTYNYIKLLATLLSTIIAAILLDIFNLRITIIIVSILFLISGIMDYKMKFEDRLAPDSPLPSIASDLRQTMKYIKGKRLSNLVFINISSNIVYFMLITFAIPYIIIYDLGLAPLLFALVLFFHTIGSLIGKKVSYYFDLPHRVLCTISFSGQIALIVVLYIVYHRLDAGKFSMEPVDVLMFNIPRGNFIFFLYTSIALLISGFLHQFLNTPVEKAIDFETSPNMIKKVLNLVSVYSLAVNSLLVIFVSRTSVIIGTIFLLLVLVALASIALILTRGLPILQDEPYRKQAKPGAAIKQVNSKSKDKNNDNLD